MGSSTQNKPPAVMLFDRYLDFFSDLSSGDVGNIVLSILQYARDGSISTSLAGESKAYFNVLRSDYDRNRDIYTEKCERNRKNAEKRWEKPDANACGRMRSHNSHAVDANINININKHKENINTLYAQKFERFWSIYPRKQAKKAALKAFNKLKPDDLLFQKIISSLEIQKRSTEWTRSNGQFIPYAATWLNGARWEDTMDGNKIQQNNNLFNWDCDEVI